MGIEIPAVEGGVYLNGNRVSAAEDPNAEIEESNGSEVELSNAQDPLELIADLGAGAVAFTIPASDRVDPSVVVMNTGSIPPGLLAPYPDLTVLAAPGRGIVNNNGSVTLQTNPAGTGSVIINNRIEAKTLTIVAGGDLYVNTTSTYNTSGQPDGQTGYATRRRLRQQRRRPTAAGVAPACVGRSAPSKVGQYTCGLADRRPASCTTTSTATGSVYSCRWPDGTSPQLRPSLAAPIHDPGDGAAATITGGRIFISAPIINVNGVIQSGRDEYVLGSAARPPPARPCSTRRSP